MTQTSKNVAPNSTGQLSLTLPRPVPRYDRDRYILSSSNDEAWRAGQAWLKSDQQALSLCGPEGAGKTHFAHLLLEQGGGVYFEGIENLGPEMPAMLIAIDDFGQGGEPEHLLARIEDLLGANKRLILIGRGHPSEWANGLMDLRTRLEAMPRAQLSEPDEAMLRAVMAKGFKDRQITVSQSVIDYAAVRLPRTFLAAHSFVDAADNAALNEKKKISVQLAQ